MEPKNEISEGPSWLACLSATAGFALVCLIAIYFSYQGAGAAGSGPGGWNIHAIFVLPAVLVLGIMATCISVAIAAVSPVHVFLRLLIALGGSWGGSFFIAFMLFQFLRSR